MKQYVTFWSVDYRKLGDFAVRREWFADFKAAKAFAAHPYTDKPVKHTFSNPDKIAIVRSMIGE